jgi:hypothetical protein
MDYSTRTKRRSTGKGGDADGSSKRSKVSWSPRKCGGLIFPNISASFSASSWTNGFEADFKFTMKKFRKAKEDGVTLYKGYSELFECSVYRNEDNTYYFVDGVPLCDGGKALNELATKLATLSADEAKAAIEEQKKIGPIRNGLPTEDVLASLRDDTMDVDTAASTAPSSHPSTILPSPDRQQVTDNNTGVVSPPSDDMNARSTTTSSSPGDLGFVSGAIATAFHRAKEIEILYEGLKGEVSMKTVEIESKNTEIKAKDATIVSLKNKVTEVTTAKDAAKTVEIESKNTEIKAKDATIVSLKNKVTEVTTAKDAVIGSLEDKVTEIESNNTQLEAKNAKIVSLTKSKTALEREVSQLKRQIAPQQTSSDSETDPLAGLDPDLVKKVEGMLRKPDPNGATLDDIAGMGQYLQYVHAHCRSPKDRGMAANNTLA